MLVHVFVCFSTSVYHVSAGLLVLLYGFFTVFGITKWAFSPHAVILGITTWFFLGYMVLPLVLPLGCDISCGVTIENILLHVVLPFGVTSAV